MHTTLKHIYRFLRRPIVSFVVYPILIYWLLFSAFPQALDGSMVQGAFVFTIAVLAMIVFGLKLLIIPVSFIAHVEAKILLFFKNRGLNHTPIKVVGSQLSVVS